MKNVNSINLNEITIVNLTAHTINIINPALGLDLSIPAEGIDVRVATEVTEDFGNGIFKIGYGEVTGLPDPKEGTIFIVSSMVLAAVGNSRSDVFAPASFAPIRDNQGRIIGVPGLVGN